MLLNLSLTASNVLCTFHIQPYIRRVYGQSMYATKQAESETEVELVATTVLSWQLAHAI